MSDTDRTISAEKLPDDPADAPLRPQTLAEFTGQKASRENLAVFIAAAKSRNEPLDHVLLHGPPGLGKTTLAQIVAREMGVGFRATSGPVIDKADHPAMKGVEAFEAWDETYVHTKLTDDRDVLMHRDAENGRKEPWT